jgi:hypothetical protein
MRSFGGVGRQAHSGRDSEGSVCSTATTLAGTGGDKPHLRPVCLANTPPLY